MAKKPSNLTTRSSNTRLSPGQWMFNKLKKQYEDKITILQTSIDRAIADKQEAIADKKAAIERNNTILKTSIDRAIADKQEAIADKKAAIERNDAILKAIEVCIQS